MRAHLYAAYVAHDARAARLLRFPSLHAAQHLRCRLHWPDTLDRMTDTLFTTCPCLTDLDNPVRHALYTFCSAAGTFWSPHHPLPPCGIRRTTLFKWISVWQTATTPAPEAYIF